MVGARTTVVGSLAYTDPDGDVVVLAGELTLPDGSGRPLPTTAVAQADGLTAGEITFAIVVVAPEAGRYLLDVWLVDAAGGESSVLTGALTAE